MHDESPRRIRRARPPGDEVEFVKDAARRLLALTVARVTLEVDLMHTGHNLLVLAWAPFAERTRRTAAHPAIAVSVARDELP